jgi:hypothetical protein
MFPGVGSALLRTLLVKDGKVAEGMFVVSGTPDGSRHGSAFMATGVTAPKNEFQPSLEILLKAVGSVTLEQSYTDNGLRTLVENGQTLRAISKTLDETSGIITKGWEGRRKTGDIMAEQRSNKILGVERVQNPNTGEVYEVPNGYYEQHNLNRNSFTTGNLQQISDDAFELWTTPPLNGNRIY